MAGELRVEYHHHLEEIRAALSRMIVLVQEAIGGAEAAFLAGEDDAAQRVEATRDIIEEFHRTVESLVVEQLVRQQPVAGELRFLVAALRIVPELELTAALARDVARRGRMHIGNELPPRVRGLVAQLFDQARDMWRQVTDAFAEGNEQIADHLEQEDERIDDLYTGLIGELASGVLRAPVLIEMALVARFLERLGDHAVEVGYWIESFSSGQPRASRGG